MSFGAGAWTTTDWLFVAFATACSSSAAGATEGSSIALIHADYKYVAGSWPRPDVDTGRARKAGPITVIIRVSTAAVNGSA